MTRTASRPHVPALVTLLLAALAAVLLPSAPADASGGAITPGDRVVVSRGPGATDKAQCTANFIFTDRTGARFIGMSAHCASATDGTSPDGCRERSLPLGTEVRIDGATRPGKLAYSSWATMRRVGERDRSACIHNDFALVRIDPADHRRVNPTVPVFGGPTGITARSQPGDRVYSYGNSGLRPGSSLDAKRGTSYGTTADGWATRVFTVTPGIPGDSGSGFLDAQGRAIGVLSTLSVLPNPGHNTITNLARALEYMERHTALRVHMPDGWRPFRA